jgi:hypothetical protein
VIESKEDFLQGISNLIQLQLRPAVRPATRQQQARQRAQQQARQRAQQQARQRAQQQARSRENQEQQDQDI